jgi:hypothetical protein
VARYTANTADVAAQGAAVTHTGLHDAARSATEVGHYQEAIGLLDREIQKTESSIAVRGFSLHVAHTALGLNYLALGNDERAMAELAKSLKGPIDKSYRTGPSMALAAVLLPKHKDAVISYLAACAGIQQWAGSAQATIWLQQIEKGATPDFGRQASGITWR